MLTPRHQALLATLAGMTVGVAVFGTVLAINNASSPDTSADTVRTSPTPTPKPSATDGLQPGSLQFTTANFGSDKAPITSEVPAGWKSTQEVSARGTPIRPASGRSASTPAAASSRRTSRWTPAPGASTRRTSK